MHFKDTWEKQVKMLEIGLSMGNIPPDMELLELRGRLYEYLKGKSQ